MIPRYDYVQYRGGVNPDQLLRWLDVFIVRRLADALRGPVALTVGNSGTAITLRLPLAHLTKVTLSANTTITLSTEAQAGDEARLELTQDATGGRTVAWVNATGDNGVVPSPTATAAKRTLYGLTYNGTSWVARILASNY